MLLQQRVGLSPVPEGAAGAENAASPPMTRERSFSSAQRLGDRLGDPSPRERASSSSAAAAAAYGFGGGSAFDGYPAPAAEPLPPARARFLAPQLPPPQPPQQQQQQLLPMPRMFDAGDLAATPPELPPAFLGDSSVDEGYGGGGGGK